jgi:hypothetical protein
LNEKVAAPVKKTELTARGSVALTTRHPLFPLKLALTPSTSGGRSVGIVRLRTKGHGVYFSFKFVKLLFLCPLCTGSKGHKSGHRHSTCISALALV